MHLAPLLLIALAVVVAVVMARARQGGSADAAGTTAPADAARAAQGAPVSDHSVGLLDSLGAFVVKLWNPPAAAAPYVGAIAAAEAKYGLPSNLLARQLDIESDHYAPDVIAGRRLSSAGAIGIGQFVPATAAE